MPTANHPYPLLSQIGNTPLLELNFAAEGVTIFAKAEFLNPSGSIKDRLAPTILADAEERGLLRPDSVILECTSGNTGIALAMVDAAMGYRVKILMSHRASVERRHLIRQLGGEIELFEPTEGYATGINRTCEMAAADPKYFLPRQFENPFNAIDHEHATGQEILRQIAGGRVDAFVSGYGTGGTITGCGRALKAVNSETRIVAIEPDEAAMLSGEMPCCHLIEGIAGGYIPPIVREAPIDEKQRVSSADAMAMTRRLSREFGLLVGTSSGANLCAAINVARELGTDARVVTILCDRAERYYSTSLFESESD